MKHSANVLVTCAGKWVGHVLQLRLAMQEIDAIRHGKLFVADRAPVTPAGYFADMQFTVPPIPAFDYIDALLDICRRHDVRVVVPLIDIDLLRLTEHEERFAQIGTTLVSPGRRIADLCFDKLAFEAFAGTEGIPMPRRFTATEIDGAPFPLFFKPPRGFGSINTGVCATVDDAKKLLATRPETILQEYVQAPEISVDAFVASSGLCTVRVQRVRDKVVGGEVVQTHTVKLADVRQVAGATIDALSRQGLRGPVNVQLLVGAKPLVIEVNSRLGSGSVFSNAACHRRLFRSVLQEACSIATDGDPEDYRENLHLYRFWGDLIHDGVTPLQVFPECRLR